MSLRAALAVVWFPAVVLVALPPADLSAQTAQQGVFGYSDFSAEAKVEQNFLAVPDAKRWRARISRRSPPSRTLRPRLRITKLPNMSHKSSVPPD